MIGQDRLTPASGQNKVNTALLKNQQCLFSCNTADCIFFPSQGCIHTSWKQRWACIYMIWKGFALDRVCSESFSMRVHYLPNLHHKRPANIEDVTWLSISITIRREIQRTLFQGHVHTPYSWLQGYCYHIGVVASAWRKASISTWRCFSTNKFTVNPFIP